MNFNIEKLKESFNNYIFDKLNKTLLDIYSIGEQDLESNDIVSKVQMSANTLWYASEVNSLSRYFPESELLEYMGYTDEMFDANDELFDEVIESLEKHKQLFDECLKTTSKIAEEKFIKNKKNTDMEKTLVSMFESNFKKIIEKCINENSNIERSDTYFISLDECSMFLVNIFPQYEKICQEMTNYEISFLKDKNTFKTYVEDIFERIFSGYYPNGWS